MPKRANGEGLIRQRKDGRWEARLRLSDGTRPTVYGKTQKEVRDKLLALRNDVVEGRVVVSDRVTVEEFLNRWLEDVVRVKNDAKTIRDYEMQTRVHFVPTFGKIPLKQLTAPDIQRWINKLSKTLAPRSVHYYRATLRAAINQAVDWHLISHNPVEATEGPKQRKRRVEAMEAQTARKILAAFEGHPLECFVTMLLLTGVRPGEALGLRWSDIDFENGTIKVQTGRSGGLKRESAWRMLPLPEVLARQLNALPRWSVLVFPNKFGSHRLVTTVLHEFQDRLAEVGLPKMKLYDLRHGHATLQLTEGATLKEIQEQLGHTQISTTMNIYTHVAPELRRRNAERMDRLFGT